MSTINNHEPVPRFNPLNDFLFFKVMGEKGDEKQLIGFLNAVLGRSGKEPSILEPIESVEIKENKTFIKDVLDGKSCILDILAILRNRTKVNIEVQIRNKNNMDRRSLFYWSKLYSESLNKGENYRKLPNVIAINIVNFNFPPKGNAHTCFRLREDTDPSLILSSALEIHFVNMVKWRKQREKGLNDPLHRWLTWFDEKSPPELVKEVLNMDSAIMAASERQDFILQDEQARRTYWSRRMAEHDRISELDWAREEGEEIGLRKGWEEGEEMGLRKGREEGEEIGQKKKAIEIARKMKETGFSGEQINALTGLSFETVAQV